MWKSTAAIAGAVAALWSGGVTASEPSDVQDPPGSVDVNQPAGVTLEERGTEADATDTMGGARTEVIDGEPGDAPAAREGTQWREVAPGAEARASLDEEPDAEPATGAADDRMPGTVYSDDTMLGTDQGYGTGTEAKPPEPAR